MLLRQQLLQAIRIDSASRVSSRIGSPVLSAIGEIHIREIVVDDGG